MKTLLKIFGVLLGLMIAAAIIVPLVVDVDKYRPQIVNTANEYINGKLELGKLKLSLWGQIRVEVQGLNLSDAQNRKIIAVDDAFFHVPFLSILSGAPELTLKMKEPMVNVVKDKTGKMNVMTLMKSSAEANPQAAPKTTHGGNIALPALALRARLGIELLDAKLAYRDEATALVSNVNKLNVKIHDLSLSRATTFEVSADLDTKMGKTLEVRGPVKMSGHAKPDFSSGKLSSLSADAKVDLDDLEIRQGTLFHKRKGMAANADLKLTSSANEGKLERFDIKFFNAEIKTTGTISNLQAPVVNLVMKSNEIDLKPWNELIPMLNDYNLAGTASLDASASGPAAQLGYKANFAIKGLTAKAPHLKTEPRFDAAVNIITDQIENFSLTMKAPGNDLVVKGKMVSFTHPKLDATVTSTGMDLDQMIDFPPPGKKATPAADTKSEKTGPQGGADAKNGVPPGKPAAPMSDYDAMLAPMRTSPMLAAMVANVGVNIKLLKAYDVKMIDMNAQLSMQDLMAGLDRFSMGLWGGVVKASMSANLKPAAPTYRFGADVTGLDIQQAVDSQFHLFRNTLLGKAAFKMDGVGTSFNPEPAKVNLNAKGNLRVAPAKFATIDVAKMASEAINQSIDRIAEKVPPLKGKKIPAGNGGKESRYESISSDFTISGGKFHSPNFYAKAEPNQGIDLKGDTKVGIVDYSLDASWEVIDTYNFTHAKDVSMDQPAHVDHILAEGNNPVKFPVHVTGNAFQPVYSYTQVPEYLGKVAANNMAKAVGGRARSEVQKKVLEHAPAPVQNAIKGLGKKFGF